MRARLFIMALAVLLMLSFEPSAFAYCTPNTPAGTVCLGAADSTCQILGLTTMDGDNQNILACMGTAAGSDCTKGQCQWKAMTSASGTMCGSVFYNSIDHSGDQSGAYWAGYVNNSPCQGQNILAEGFKYNTYGIPKNPKCPTGYTYVGFLDSWYGDFPGDPCSTHGDGSPCNVRYRQGYCFKN